MNLEEWYVNIYCAILAIPCRFEIKKTRVEKSFLALIIEQLTKDKRKKMCVYKFEMSEYKNKNKLEKLLQENMTIKETIFKV